MHGATVKVTNVQVFMTMRTEMQIILCGKTSEHAGTSECTGTSEHAGTSEYA
jgi:hypothetical protein